MDKSNRRNMLESALKPKPINPNSKEKEKTETKTDVLANQQPYGEDDIPTTSEFVGMEDLY